MAKPKPGNDNLDVLYNELMDTVADLMRTAGRLRDLQYELYPPPWAKAKKKAAR